MKEQILELLRQAEGPLSGSQIGEMLGISRSAVWKWVEALKEEGYEIDAAPHRGYQFLSASDVYNGYEISHEALTKEMGRNVVFLEETTSTNEDARRLAEEGAPQGTLVVAESQTSGRGRLGRAWTSPKKEGIWMSLILRPDVQPVEASCLTLLAGLSICQGIQDETGLEAGIKWPNDVMVQGKKAVGILTEMRAEMEKIEYVIVGIGINVNQTRFPEELKDIAISLAMAGGQPYNRAAIIKRVMAYFESYYETYCREGSFAFALPEYKKYCVTLGKQVNVLGKQPFQGLAKDVTTQGELVVEKADKEEVFVFSGEVSIRPVEGR